MRTAWLLCAGLGIISILGLGCGSDPQYFPKVSPGVTFRFTDGDQWAEGTLLNVNYDEGHVLRLNEFTEPFPFINVAASNKGTVMRVNTLTGDIVGEYRVAPEGHGLNPSRTTVDLFGNVWTGNRNEGGMITPPDGPDPDALDSYPAGSVVKIGMVIGGTRGDKLQDGTFVPNPFGEYLQPPFTYSTVVDRDGDGLIRTSGGLDQILDWPNVTDGSGGVDARVEDADDEAILIYQRTPLAPNVRHVSVDANNDVWVGGYPFSQQYFHKLDAVTGEILDSFNAADFGAGGYGGLIDGNGILWSASLSQDTVLRYAPATGIGEAIFVNDSYGMGIDTNGYIWNSTFGSHGVVKIGPDGVVEDGFPINVPGGGGCRGVAVTPSDNHIWIANSYGSDVTRLDNDGTFLKTIPVGDSPTGLAVDSEGKMWATNLSDSTLSRIDPMGGDDDLGEVDLTVDLGEGAGPYNYSDMTGAVAIGATSPQGTWTVVIDSEVDGFVWGVLSWNQEDAGFVPPGAEITVQVRAADSSPALAGLPYLPLDNGAESEVIGRYLELQITLKLSPDGESPVLSDVLVRGD